MDSLEQARCDLTGNFTPNSYDKGIQLHRKNTLAANSSRINILYQPNVKPLLRLIGYAIGF